MHISQFPSLFNLFYPRKTSQKGIDLIKHFEGFSPHSYICSAGVLTIGYGHTKTVKPNQRITQAEGDRLLTQDLRHFEKAVNELVTVSLSQSQFDALVSFAFNLGEGALRRSTLLKLLNQDNYEAASKEFLRWVKANGKTLPGLVRRRKAEADLFKS